MTTAPTVLASLLADCSARDIRLLPVGDRSLTIDAPQNVLTPDLVHRIKTHKNELLSIFDHAADTRKGDPTNAAAVWQATLDRLDGDPLFPSELMELLRSADVSWADDAPNFDTTIEPDFEALGPDGWPASCIDPDELTTCPQCDTLEPWQSLAGNWHCQNCNPPDKARQLREFALRLKTASQIDPSSTKRMPHGSEHLQHFRA